MQPLDALSALAMGHHAKDDDLLTWAWSDPAVKLQRITCKLHLLRLLHRSKHRNDAKKFKPGTIELMIMRDVMDDMLRRGNLVLYEVRAPGENWDQCPHCRVEMARKYGHLHG